MQNHKTFTVGKRMTYIFRFANIVAALRIPYPKLFHWLLATGEGHPTCLPCGRVAIKVNIFIPIPRPFNPTTLKPPLLYPVNKVLLVGVFSVGNDEGLEARRRFPLYPVLEHEPEEKISKNVG
jgi:hypothetical protein